MFKSDSSTFQPSPNCEFFELCPVHRAQSLLSIAACDLESGFPSSLESGFPTVSSLESGFPTVSSQSHEETVATQHMDALQEKCFKLLLFFSVTIGFALFIVLWLI